MLCRPPPQVHNDDGVWVRLNVESIGKWCSNGYTEGWALQYNQHLGKTLLVPVEEPKSIDDLKEDTHPKLPDVVRDNRQAKKGRSWGDKIRKDLCALVVGRIPQHRSPSPI